MINLTAIGRQTIEQHNDIMSLGGAIDYNKNKLSTGAYFMYFSKEIDEEKTKQKMAEAYGKYGNTFRGSIGIETEDDETYYFAKGALRGKRDFPKAALSLAGMGSVEYGFFNIPEFNTKPTNLEVKANGSISFKSKDFSTSLTGNLISTHTRFMLDEDKIKVHSFVGSLTGKVSTEKVDISTTLSAIKSTMRTNGEIMNDNKTSLTASIEIALKKLFGDKVTPKFTYNVGNYNGANQNLGVGVILTP